MSTQQLPPALDRAGFYQTTLPQMAERFPTLDAGSAEVILSLAVAYDTVSTHFNRRLAKYQLSMPSFNLLMVLNSPSYSDSGCPMSQLGDLLLVSKANITGIVDSLTRKQLVARAEASYDRRVKLASITPQGRALLRRILPGHFQEVTRVIGSVPARERAQLKKLLTLLVERVREAGDTSHATKKR